MGNLHFDSSVVGFAPDDIVDRLGHIHNGICDIGLFIIGNFP